MALAPEKMEEIVGTLSGLTILEIADLVKHAMILFELC